MTRTLRQRLMTGLALAALAAAPAFAQQSPAPQRQAFFGDLHLHSGYSLDAFALGARVMPDDSFNFDKGLPVKAGAIVRH